MFRFHKSCLMNPVVKYLIIFGSSLLFLFFLFTSYNLFIVHSQFVNKGTILSEKISVQMKAEMHRQYQSSFSEAENLLLLSDALAKDYPLSETE